MNSDSRQPRASKSDLLISLAALSEDDPRFAAVLAALDRQPRKEAVSLRLYRMHEAVKATGRSRTSLWRAIAEGKLKFVQLRAGGCRLIPEAELQKLVGGGA